MMPASIAWSSRQMGSLLEWRNRPAYRAGRVFVTQLTLPLLTLAATIETAVDLVLWPIHRTRCGSRLSSPLSSAYFAIQWSLVSFGTNFICPWKLRTEERAARMEIGRAWKWRLGAVIASSLAINILLSVTVPPLSMLITLLVAYLAVMIAARDPRRRQDYINRALEERAQHPRPWGNDANNLNDLIREMNNYINNMNDFIPQMNNGIPNMNMPLPPRLEDHRAFFEELMDPQAFSDEAIEAFPFFEAAIVNLLLTRTIYLYAYGNHYNDALPSFLNDRTREHIEQLRLRTDVTHEICQVIEARLRNLNFNELDAQTPQAVRALIEAGQSCSQNNSHFFRLSGEYLASQRAAA